MDLAQGTIENLDLTEFDPINYLAIDLLEKVNNFAPSIKEIIQMESLIMEKLQELTQSYKKEK